MKNEAFVYKWVNLSNGKFYIGYHKGNINDGYISSSHNKSFWEDFYNPEMIWKRELLFFGDKKDCLTEEQRLLTNLDLSQENIYNNCRGAQLIFTNDVIKKMSESAKKRWNNMSEDEKKIRNNKISKSKLGIKRTNEVKQKISNFFTGKSFIERFGKEKALEICKKISDSNRGKNYHTEEWKKKLSEKMKNNDYGKYQTSVSLEKKRNSFLTNNPGKNKSDETKQKISNSLKGRIGKNNKPIIINGIEYRSLADASSKLGIHPMTIKYRIISKNIIFKDYQYK